MTASNIDKTPIKRNKFLQPVSREHYHALLLCRKIKVGFAKDISATRIKSYAEWFYKNHIVPHFELEEKYLFPILGTDHELVKEAIAAHRLLASLFAQTINVENALKQIQLELDKHVRFEERILFNEIQKAATAAQLLKIQEVHVEVDFEENVTDVFW